MSANIDNRFGAEMRHETDTEIHVDKTASGLGADVCGIDLACSIDKDAFNRIVDAWHENLVLRFRGQHLSDQNLLQFSRCFGTLDLTPRSAAGQPWIPEFPEILVVSNIVVDGKPVGGLGSYEAQWHTDMSYLDEPPMASILYALEVPPSGGETGFANMYAAYETLPIEIKDAVEGRYLKHDATYNSTGGLRQGFTPVTDVRLAPGAIHPIVRVHPATKRKALFLGRRRNGYIQGLPVDQSEQLLDVLWDHATRAELVWEQEWRVGDLIVWDNRCTLHRRNAFDSTTRRLMHRTQIKGNRPF